MPFQIYEEKLKQYKIPAYVQKESFIAFLLKNILITRQQSYIVGIKDITLSEIAYPVMEKEIYLIDAEIKGFSYDISARTILILKVTTLTAHLIQGETLCGTAIILEKDFPSSLEYDRQKNQFKAGGKKIIKEGALLRIECTSMQKRGAYIYGSMKQPYLGLIEE